MLTCLFGFVLLFSSIIMHFFVKKNTLIDTLSPDLESKYDSIIKERLQIYTMGIVLGIILGLIYLYMYSGGIRNMCMFIVIVMSVKLTFYYFYPKSDYMLYHLQTKEQVKAWTDVYKNYKNAWKYSLIVSFIGYILISYGLNNY